MDIFSVTDIANYAPKMEHFLPQKAKSTFSLPLYIVFLWIQHGMWTDVFSGIGDD